LAEAFGHEKLRVYQKAVRFVARAQAVLSNFREPEAVADHLDRASESVVLNIVQANARWSARDRARYLDVAHGSGLECAACLDVCATKALISEEQCQLSKKDVSAIVAMLIGLRDSRPSSVQESHADYGKAEPDQGAGVFFSHERLDAYQTSLDFVRWIDRYRGTHTLLGRHAKQLEAKSICIVLNVAEGNGRFSVLDRRRFLDISRNAALHAAACLDIVATRAGSREPETEEGKELLGRIVAMLTSMRWKAEYLRSLSQE
jgi:four helix bundle protein